LRTALARSEFELHYQPKVAAVTRKMVGIEALIRWKPQGSDHLVPPAAFVPVLEDTGMIIEVGRWVLETACSQYMLWRKRGMGAIMLSVNVSAVQFDHGSLPKTVATVLEQTGMPPAQLCLELTERIVVKDIGETVTTLQKLSAIGIKLSIDDFGIGYSSLNYLKNMPINELKIDRSFVMSLPDDAASIAIVDSVLSIARGLSMNVVAEGVETIEQADFLMQRGCHELQGYLFSKPLSQQQLYGWCKDKEYCAGHHEQRLVCTWHEPAPVAQLAGGIAHDFKNLMTGVIGNLSIAKHHLDEHHKSTEAIKRAEKASQRATELAQTLMSIARPGALPPTGCPIQKVIDECLALSLAGSTVHAAVSVAETCSEAAVPEGELCQIVTNLTINALQAMPADGTLIITAETVSIPLENRFGIKSGRYVQIDIRDSGCGMSPKVMAKAFDPYFTTKSGGNGLGLASVKALITKNGGGICMTSEVGAGTSVTIVIPAAEQHSTLHTG
jgi:EAL domain-containing protein (putative c-di-GMP-specific phosphodiesterase class I)